MRRWRLIGGWAALGMTVAAAASEPAAVPATIALPDLTVAATAADRADFDKYFFFHQDGVSFETALADITECDALASGFPRRSGPGPYNSVLAQQYGVGGAIGGALGSAISDAIIGSAGARKARRISMRNCMAFKGYRRHGLPKPVWETFNFEEGGSRKPEDERSRALLLQARIASGPKPVLEVLEP